MQPIKSIFNSVHASQQCGINLVDGAASRYSIVGGEFGQASSNATLQHLLQNPTDQSFKQPTDSEGGLSNFQPTPERAVASHSDPNPSGQRQPKGLNQGPTPSHDVVANSQSASQAVGPLTPMNERPAKQFASARKKEKACGDLSGQHATTKVSGEQQSQLDDESPKQLVGSASASAGRKPPSIGSSAGISSGKGRNHSHGKKSSSSEAKKTG